MAQFLPRRDQEKLNNPHAWHNLFLDQVTKRVPEERVAELFDVGNGRPNAPIRLLELGEYCRRQGLFPEQRNARRALCRQANAPLPTKAERAELRAERAQVQRRTRGLQRKDRALAEDAALLALQTGNPARGSRKTMRLSFDHGGGVAASGRLAATRSRQSDTSNR